MFCLQLNETGAESSATSFNTSDRQSSPPKQVVAEVSENTEASADDESTLIDRNKLACLLCKRKFDSLDILNKHIAKSDLHKVYTHLNILFILEWNFFDLNSIYQKKTNQYLYLYIYECK